jgi:hypothetical protein
VEALDGRREAWWALDEVTRLTNANAGAISSVQTAGNENQTVGP